MINKMQTVLEYNLPIKITPQPEGGFVVTCPVWSDCFAQGDTIDEAVLEITAVAKSLIAVYKEEGLKVPLKAQKQTKTVSSFEVPIIVVA